ncbi:hypothetical protein DDJ87_08705 [Mycobacteroides abscessus]|nr:hypothetical protein DDJ87_08705 [Mycobacteroides abscessus]
MPLGTRSPTYALGNLSRGGRAMHRFYAEGPTLSPLHGLGDPQAGGDGGTEPPRSCQCSISSGLAGTANALSMLRSARATVAR